MDESKRTITWDDKEYHVECPKCSGSDFAFDAHSGSYRCKSCGYDTYGVGLESILQPVLEDGHA